MGLIFQTSHLIRWRGKKHTSRMVEVEETVTQSDEPVVEVEETVTQSDKPAESAWTARQEGKKKPVCIVRYL